MKSLKEQVEDLNISQSQDIDPEDDPFAKRDDDSDSDEAPSEAGITGREHYEEVPKSKLRKPEQPALGDQYTGAAVRRKTLFDDSGNVQERDTEDAEDDDEDSSSISGSELSVSRVKSNDVLSSGSEEVEETMYTDLKADDFVDRDGDDPEIESDEAFESGDEENFKSKGFLFRGSKKDALPMDFAEEGISDEDGALMWDTEDEEMIESDQDMEMNEISSDSEEGSQDISGASSASDSDLNTSSQPSRKHVTDRERIKDMLVNEAAAVTSTLSASANADVLKGKAVKQQYHTFDQLLDARIKLQKGLVAASSITSETNSHAELLPAVQSAEAAALKLFSTIESIRHSMSEATSVNTSKKRKRLTPPSPSTSAKALWARLSSLEDQSLPYRRTILNKWSLKTRSENDIFASRSKLDRGTHRETITDILDSHIASENQNTDAISAYDDTTFYQSLLRDLISSRASLSQSQSTISEFTLPKAPKQHRKGVDTKASKGRKVRYTVHEKLQNFTAEEDRGTWTESAKKEFFASLFGGQGKVLDEDELVENGDVDEMLGEAGALRLFRS